MYFESYHILLSSHTYMPYSPNFQSAINKWATKVGWWCKKVTCGEIYWDKNLYLVAQTDCKVANDDRVKGYLYWGLIDCWPYFTQGTKSHIYKDIKSN